LQTLLFEYHSYARPLLHIIIANVTLYYMSILQCTNYCCDTTLTHVQLFLRRDIGCFVSGVAVFGYKQLAVLAIFGSI